MESRGRVNIYVCKDCKLHIVTINRDEGVTPFGIRCRGIFGCGKADAFSSFYRVPQNTQPEYEWYRPEEEEMKKLNPGELDHVKKGGLLLRPVRIETLEENGFRFRFA